MGGRWATGGWVRIFRDAAPVVLHVPGLCRPGFKDKHVVEDRVEDKLNRKDRIEEGQG